MLRMFSFLESKKETSCSGNNLMSVFQKINQIDKKEGGYTLLLNSWVEENYQAVPKTPAETSTDMVSGWKPSKTS